MYESQRGIDLNFSAASIGNFSFTDYQASFDLNLTDALPLENATSVSCRNITGNATDLCTVTGGTGDFSFTDYQASFDLNNSAGWDSLLMWLNDSAQYGDFNFTDFANKVARHLA